MVITWDEASALWLTKVINRRRAFRTWETYEYALKNFKRHTGVNVLSEFDEVLLMRYVEARSELAHNTLTLYLIALRQFGQWCIKRGYLAADPFDDYAVERRKDGPRNWLSVEQLRGLLNYECPALPTYVNGRNRLAWGFMALAGLRVSEVIGLRVRDVDAEKNLVWVTGKGDKRRAVPLLPALARMVTGYLPMVHWKLLRVAGPDDWLFPGRPYTEPVTRALLNIMLQRSCEALGLRDISPHSLRHTYATLLVNGGASVQALQSMLGHVDINTTMVYVHQSTAQITASAMLHPLSNEL